MSRTSGRYRRKTVSKPSTSKVMVLAGAGFAVLVIVAVLVLRFTRPTTYTVADAAVLALDQKAQLVTIEHADADGDKQRVWVTIPPECELQIDGQPANYRDLRIGDRGALHVTAYRGRARAHWVHITRAATSAPATPSASAPAVLPP
ncbi:MAG: hypothetical protein AB1716_11320 [Planctomycetota bacterium]